MLVMAIGGVVHFVNGLFNRLDKSQSLLLGLNQLVEKLNKRLREIETLKTESKLSADAAAAPAEESGKASASIWHNPILPGYTPPETPSRPAIPPLPPPIIAPIPPLKSEMQFAAAPNLDILTGRLVESSPAEKENTLDSPLEAIIVEDDSDLPRIAEVEPHNAADQTTQNALKRLYDAEEENQRRHAPAPQMPSYSFYSERRETSDFDQRAMEIFRKGWNWFWLGKEQLEPDDKLEYVIASNWLTRLGMIILVLGLGYFIKYSIDKGWLVPEMRIMGTTLAGIAMYLWGLRLWKGAMNIMGQAFIAGGAATLYFSAYASSEMYQLISSETAFVMACAITVLLVVSALKRSSQLIAVLGMLGAYATPLMFEIVPQSPYPILIYLTVLAAGLAIIRQKQNWVLPVWIAGFGTAILFAGIAHPFFFRFPPPVEAPALEWTYVFLGFVFILFVLMDLCAEGPVIRRNKPGEFWEIILMLLTALVYYFASYSIIKHGIPVEFNGQYDQIVALRILCGASAAFFFLQSYLLKTINKTDVVHWAVCCALGFIFMAAGVGLTVAGEWRIPLWMLEATAFLWVSYQAKSAVLAYLARTSGAILLVIIGFITLWMAYHVTPALFFNAKEFFLPIRVYNPGTAFFYVQPDLCFPLVFERICRFLVPALCGLTMALMSRKYSEFDENCNFTQILLVLSSIVFIEYLSAETNLICGVYYPELRLGAQSVLWTIIALSLIIFGMKQNLRPVRMVGLAFFAIIIGKIFFVDLSGLGQIYRIGAMVILGLLILTGGWLYLSRKESERRQSFQTASESQAETDSAE